MKYVDEFRERRHVLELAERIRREAVRPVRFMEVCGTHTMAIARHGLRSLMPESVRLVSGPGCPLCVTPQAQIDRFLGLGKSPDTILATFGDMMRVPGTHSSLERARAGGADVRVVYSPLDAVDIATRNLERQVVFFGVGFETTSPAISLAVLDAGEIGLTNFKVLAAQKLIPPAMMALASDEDVAVDGFICPGHVSAVIGSAAYEEIANLGIACVVSGFEPADILQAILMLVRQCMEGRSEVEVQYSRVVTREGNPAAKECIRTVFEPADAEWRGLGTIPASGLVFRREFADFEVATAVSARDFMESACECGLILKGSKSPSECAAFGTGCTPDQPLGPCMVSTEGACAAEYRYQGMEVAHSDG